MSKIGFDGVFEVSSTGDTVGAETMVAMEGVRDVSTSVSMDTAEVSDRSSAFKLYTQGMVDLETTVEATYNTDNTQLMFCVDQCIARGSVKIAVLDGPSGQGFTYWAMVTSSDINQPLTDGMTVSLTFKPVQTYTSLGALVPPQWTS